MIILKSTELRSISLFGVLLWWVGLDAQRRRILRREHHKFWPNVWIHMVLANVEKRDLFTSQELGLELLCRQDWNGRSKSQKTLEKWKVQINQFGNNSIPNRTTIDESNQKQIKEIVASASRHGQNPRYLNRVGKTFHLRESSWESKKSLKRSGFRGFQIKRRKIRRSIWIRNFAASHWTKRSYWQMGNAF